MKYLLAATILVGGCSDGGGSKLIAAPADCDPGMLAYATDLDGATSTSGSIALANGYGFANKVSNDPGELIVDGVGSGADPWVHVLFDSLVVDGGTVAARGAIAMPDLGVAGADCETEPPSGTITVGHDTPQFYKFQLTNLRAGTTCDAPLIAGSFSGCLRDSQ